MTTNNGNSIMADLLKPLGLALLLALAGPAAAQDAEAPETADAPEAAEAPAAPEAPMAATAGEDATYIDEVFTDWQRECLRTETGEDPCRMAQVLFDAEQTPVGKLAIGRQAPGSPAVAVGELALPVDLGILLPQGLMIGVDRGLSKQYDFYMCLPDGCIARLLFGPDDVAAFKAGEVMNLGLVAFLPPDREPTRIVIPVSLKGFTAAYDSLPVPAPAPAAEAPAPAPEAPAEAPAAE
jgi:invasion protein IalB